MGPYMEKVGFYVDRWAIIWTDEPLCGHMGFYLEDGPLSGQSGPLYGHNGLLSGQMGPYVDRVGPYVDRVGFYLDIWALIWKMGL